MKRKPKVEVFRSSRANTSFSSTILTDEWCWRLRAANGRIIACSSGESYRRKAHCLRVVKQLFPSFTVKEIEE